MRRTRPTTPTTRSPGGLAISPTGSRRPPARSARGLAWMSATSGGNGTAAATYASPGTMRLGIADHLGWAIAVTASADHEVVDRRRIELVEPGVTPAPIHYESARLDVAATAALVAEVRASVARASAAALDELAGSLPG